MKMLFIIGLMLSAQTVLASKARLSALGQGTDGSYYIDDTRGVFLNPARINNTSDFANFEMGTSNIPATTAAASTTPIAEGGVFKKVGSVKAGLQLGKSTNATSKIQGSNQNIAALTGNSLITPQNTITAVIGSESSFKWGGALIYGSAEENASPGFPTRKANTLEAKGGVILDKWEIFGGLDIFTNSESEIAAGSTNKLEGKASFGTGAVFNAESFRKFYADVSLASWTVKNSTTALDTSVDSSTFTLGMVEFLNPEDTTKFFVAPSVALVTLKYSPANGTETKSEALRLPIVVGLESAASDWLTLQASVAQRVLVDQNKETENTDSHDPNSTVVAVGASIKWKKITLDTTLAGSTTGNINGNSLFANAGLTYLF